MGVRVFDVRVCDDTGDGQVCVSHTFISDLTLEDVLADFAAFLAHHPGEFVMVHVRKDRRRRLSDGGETAIRELFARCLFRYASFSPLGLDTPLRALAGSLVVVSASGLICCDNMWPPDLFDGAGFIPMWHWSNRKEAQARVEEHVLSDQLLLTTPCHITGIALDGSFGGIPPAFTSAGINRWFLRKTREEWRPQHLGLVLVDFANADFCAELVTASLIKGGAQCQVTSTIADACSCDVVPCPPLPDVGGICHVGASRRANMKSVVVASRSDVPEEATIVVEAYGNNSTDTYSCTGLRTDVRQIEISVQRTDQLAGWGLDLFVKWKAM